MLLSIITINLNNAHGLKRTMDSISSQTIQGFEWFVIDGGSTDGSIELLESFKEHITAFTSEPDHGVYHAMNKGIMKASGDYLLFMNSGDRFADESVLHNFCSYCDGSDLIVGQSVQEGDTPSAMGEMAFSKEEEVFRLCVSAFPHQATFIRREVFEKYGLYREDKRIASDWYSTINALFKGEATVSHLPILVSICEKDGISSRLNKDLFQERKNLIRENPYFAVLFEFFTDNRDIVTALKSNKIAFFFFRVYFFFYRKMKGLC